MERDFKIQEKCEMNATMIKGERSKLLAVVAIMAMVVCTFAIALPGTDSVEAADGDVAQIVSSGQTFSTLQLAIDQADSDDIIKLINDISESVNVGSDDNIAIDINGHVFMDGGDDNITNGGNLTIFDSNETGIGKIVNNTAGTSAILNDVGGTVTIENGVFEKTNAINSSDYYLITNHGVLFTINGGTFTSASSNSSCIENGWYTPSNNTSKAVSEMIINDGTIANNGTTANGGLYTIKNDDYGKMTINGGTFINTTPKAGTILNWNDLTINGGVFTASNASLVTGAEGNDTPKNSYELGKTVINGGLFNSPMGYISGYDTAVSIQIKSLTIGKVFDIPTTAVTDSDTEIILMTGASLQISSGANLSGTVSYTETTVNGDVTASISLENLKAGTGNIVISTGSIYISGTIDASAPVTINAQGEVLISGQVAQEGTTGGLTITKTGDDSSVTLKDLTINTGASLIIQTDVTVENVTNNGSVTVSSEAEVSGEIVNNGAVIGDDGVYHVSTYDGLVQAIMNKGATVVLDADIVATSYITSTTGDNVTIDLNGFDLSMGGYPINLAGLTLEIPSGSEFSTNERVSYVGNIVTEAGSRIVLGTGYSLYTDQTTASVKYPAMAEGAILSITSGDWTVFNETFVTQDGDKIAVSYGIAMVNPVYDGAPVVLRDFNLRITLFSAVDEDGNAQTFSASLDFALTTITGNGDIIDAGTYNDRLEIAVQLSDGITNDYSYNDVDIVVRKASSTITVSQPTSDIEEQQTSVKVTANGNDYTVTGSLVQVEGSYYLTLPVGTAVEYYTSGEGGYVLTEVVLVPSMFVDAVYDNGMITINLGESVPAEYSFTVDFDTIKNKDNWTTETYKLDLSGMSVESIIGFGTYSEEDTVYDVTIGDLQSGIGFTSDGKTYTVTGTVFYYDGGWAPQVWGDVDHKGYYLLYCLTVPGQPEFDWSGATISFDGKAFNGTSQWKFNGGMLKYLGTSLDQAPTTITVDLDGNGTKYSESTYTLNYDLDASVKIDFVAIDDNNINEVTGGDDLYGKKPSELYSSLALTGGQGNTYDVTGTVNWVYEYTQFNTAKYNEQSGYYIAFYIDLPDGVDWNGVKVSTSNKTWDGTDEVFDGYFVYRVMNNDPITITIDLDGEAGTTYGAVEYTLDLSVNYGTSSGYVPEATHGAETDLNGVVVTDAIDRTMFMIFNTEGVTGEYTMQVLRNDEIIYTDDDAMWDDLGNGTYIWYLSFDDQLKDLFENSADIGGLYTMMATNGGYTVKADIKVAGTIDAGYDDSAKVVYDDMDAAGIKFPTTEYTKYIAPSTMWIVWYNDEVLTGSVTAYLYLGDDLTTPIWSETDNTKWLEAGYRAWYFSFADGQPARESGLPALQYGTYTMVVMNGNDELARGVVEVIDADSWTVTFNEYNETYDDDNQYDITTTFQTGDLYKLPGTNYKDKSLLGWDLYVKVDGEWQFVRNYEENGAIHFGYIDFGDIENPGQELEFRAVYGSSGVSAATDYTVKASIENGKLVIEAEGIDGTVNANFGFTYVLHGRTMGSEGWEVDVWDTDKAVISGLAANGTASAINEYSIPSGLKSGDKLDITLTVVSGNNVIECGTTTITIQ